MKRGETPEAACRREIREETNLDIHELRHHGTFSWTREFKRDTIHVFTARTSGDVTIDGHELIDSQWVDFHKLPREEVSGVAHRVMRLIGADGV